ncbi:MAG: hypothetical protein QXN15_10940 [Candidatus Jordarchaeales archaeon]|nr:hypothetical protein [Candidatus Jordarchaeia archaeon]
MTEFVLASKLHEGRFASLCRKLRQAKQLTETFQFRDNLEKEHVQVKVRRKIISR